MDDKCQTMDAVYDCHVTSPGPRKVYFGLAEVKWKKRYITIIKSHSTTNDIHVRQHFQVVCGI